MLWLQINIVMMLSGQLCWYSTRNSYKLATFVVPLMLSSRATYLAELLVSTNFIIKILISVYQTYWTLLGLAQSVTHPEKATRNINPTQGTGKKTKRKTTVFVWSCMVLACLHCISSYHSNATLRHPWLCVPVPFIVSNSLFGQSNTIFKWNTIPS